MTPETDELRQAVVAAIRKIYDPEIPVNIYELGLIYDIAIDGEGDVTIQMTLTSPQCPVAETLPPQVQQMVASIPGVSEAKVDIVWEPPWSMDKMTEAAKLQLGLV